MDTIFVHENNKNRKKHSKIQQLENITVNDNNKEAFSWLLEFNKNACLSAGNRNYQHLKQLLLLYTQNILSSMETNNVKFSDEINLKNNINNVLIFFHLYWLDIKQEIADHNLTNHHSLYLNKMSALLSVYINMELRISGQEIVKILAALYIYLNNSEEHIFKVLLRINHMTEKYTQICNIFVKSFSNLKIKKTSLTDVTYIRYLLFFKIWKKVEKLSNKKEKVDELALKLLGPHIPKLRDELLEFVPRPPMDQKNETLWLLQPNSFNLEQMHKDFLLFEDKMDKNFLPHEDQIDKHLLLPEDKIGGNPADYIDQQNCLKSQKYGFRSNPNRSNLTSNHEVNMPVGINRNKSSKEQINLLKRKEGDLKSKKNKRKNPRNAIIIDSTGDDEISILCEIKRKKTKHKTNFLKIMKDMIKKKHINILKHSSEFVTNVNTDKSSNTDSKSTVENILEHKLNTNNNQEESKITTNMLKGTKPENHNVSPHMTYIIGNTMDLYNNTMTQRKTLTSEEEMDTILSLKVRQSDVDQDSFEQKITNCNAMQKYCSLEMMPRDIKYVRIIKKSINNHNSQFTDYIIETKVCQVNKCDCKSFIFPNNNDNSTQEHNAFTENDVKTCGDINYIENGTHYVMPDIVTCYDIHAEKRIQCLHNSNDMYTTCISTTFTEDQIGSSLDGQNVNLDNKRKYGFTHSETAIKSKQAKSDCNTLLSNNRLHPSEHFFSNIDSAFPNVDLKEADEIMETYNGDLSNDSINISSSDNQIGILEILEIMSNKTTNFFQQSLFELDNVHTNTFLSEKDILCNNQNNAINAIKFDSLAFE